jgi:hypothetical protein
MARVAPQHGSERVDLPSILSAGLLGQVPRQEFIKPVDGLAPLIARPPIPAERTFSSMKHKAKLKEV